LERHQLYFIAGFDTEHLLGAPNFSFTFQMK